MSMTIAHNIPAMNTQRQFSVSANGMSSSMQKLSSGYQINSGKDDPAGLKISEKLRSQLNGIERATQNTEEAMNVMNIAEGAMNEMNNILKTMKTLATHSANSGVTTADQVEADQVEMDSAIQTLDRIAQTTEFGSEKLLNGNKEIDFTAKTAVKGTQQNSLINERESSFSQIFKRDDYAVSISYTGATGKIDMKTDAGEDSKVDFAKQASKAYLEVDTGACLAKAGSKPQIQNGKFTQEQVFTLTGNQGSRQFTMAKGESVSQLVSSIHSAASSTGVDAALIFNSDQKVGSLEDTVSGAGMNSAAMFADSATSNTAIVFGNDYGDSSSATLTGAVKNGVNGVSFAGLDPNGNGIQWGQNTDGQGNIYVKFISDTEVELYKDSSMSRESLVGTANGPASAGADSTWTVQEANNSGLGGMTLDIMQSTGTDKQDLTDLKGIKIATGGIRGNSVSDVNNVDSDGNQVGDITWSGNAAGASTAGKLFDSGKTTITGVELGTNTSASGQIFFKTVHDSDGTIQAFAYKDEEMTQLVAQSEKVNFADVDDAGLLLNEVRNSDNTAGTGLSIAMGFNTTTTATMDTDGPDDGKTTYTGNLTFNNLGARIFSTEYGDDAYIKVTQDKGAIFTSYDNAGDSTRSLIDAGEKGTTKLVTGQDATVSVNGKEVKTSGLNLKVATQDIQADFTFNAGKVGSTTMAQVGYETVSLFTKAGALNIGENRELGKDATKTGTYETLYEGLSGYLANAGHNTTESIGDFKGGMQLQLGEGSGDQNRTTVSMKSMTSENLGRTTVGGYWDVSNPTVYSEKTLTLKDCMGGGAAALTDDPTLTMKIIDKAIDDVSTQRAVLGAIQSNLLQTNINNLEVTLENVTATEAGIRDTDMASEMSEFTKNQVLQSAAMSMMSQANSASQNVLQLLR